MLFPLPGTFLFPQSHTIHSLKAKHGPGVQHCVSGAQDEKYLLRGLAGLEPG
jgi:hypothetical protein